MGRHKNSTEKQWSELAPTEQKMRALMDSKSLTALGNGVFLCAQSFKTALVDIPALNAGKPQKTIEILQNSFLDKSKVELIEIMTAATKSGSGDLLRSLADAVERTGPSLPHDPLRSLLIDIKRGSVESMEPRQLKERLAKLGHDTTTKSVIRAARELAAPIKQGKRGLRKGQKRKSVHLVSR